MLQLWMLCFVAMNRCPNRGERRSSQILHNELMSRHRLFVQLVPLWSRLGNFAHPRLPLQVQVMVMAIDCQ
jgi:hypothetical protein